METNILLIEDNPGDARLILEMLKEAGGDGFVVDRADTLSRAAEKLRTQPTDAVLLDLNLPDSQGLDTFSWIHSQFAEVPIVVLTGFSNEEMGMQAVRGGAQDYLVKGVISGTALTRVLQYGIERKHAEEVLRASERRYRLLFEHNMAALLRTVGDGHIVDANEACVRMLGYASREELRKRQVWDLWRNPEELPDFIARLQKERALTSIELCLRRKDATRVVALANVTLNGGNTTEAAVIEATMIDITDRKRAEEALYRNQRVLAQAEQIAHLGAWEMKISNREDLSQNPLHWSDETYRIFGYGPGAVEATDQLFFRHVHPDDRLCVREALAEAIAQRKPYAIEHRIQRCDGAERAVIERAEILRDSQGRPERVIGAVQDITDRKRGEEERKRLVTAIEQCAETIIITDPKGTIQYVNPTFTKVTGYTREEAVGANPRLLESGQHDASFFEGFWNTLLSGKSWHGEMINQRKDGSLYTDELHVAPVRNERGEIIHFISSHLDVTERKRAQAENLRLVAAIEQAAEGIVITDLEARIQYVNPAFTKMSGFSRAEALGRNPRFLKSGKQDRGFYQELWATILAGRVWHGEIINRHRDHSLFSVEMSITPVRDSRGGITNFIAITQDITERKRAEKALTASETRYRRLFETAQDGVLLMDPETGTITDANPFVLKLLGYTREEILGEKLWDVGPFRDVAASQDAFRNLQKAGYVRYEDLPLETKSGDRLDVEFVSNSYSEGDKTVIQCSIRDITERKWQEDMIRDSLHQKEILLKEIHHRVKNNLQVISSLLQLRAAAIRDEEALEMFRESQNRVRTMALIHEKLYRSGDFARIDFGEYLLSLVTDLFHSYHINPEAITFSVAGDKVLLGLDTAIPCALIVNELVSNCLKHAFSPRPDGSAGTPSAPVPTDSPRQQGLIAIALTAGEEGKVRLVVRDNGKGFPQSVDLRHTQSLGLHLVNALTEQLGGTIQMHADGGTEFQIEFSGQ